MQSWLYSFFKSFHYAFQGFVFSFKERNMRVHISIAYVVILLGSYLRLPLNFWIILILLIGLVIAAELFNTSIEELADQIRDQQKLDFHATKSARDLSAAAVLVMAVVAAIIGLIIFLPLI